MGKLGAYGDLHQKSEDFKLRAEVFENMLISMKSLGVTLCLNAGDTFDKGRIGSNIKSVGEILGSIFDPITRQGLPHIIVEGNHDYWDPMEVGAADILRHNSLITVVSGLPKVVETEDYNVVCIPWQDSLRARKVSSTPLEHSSFMKNSIREQLALCCNRKENILLGHIEFQGAKLPNKTKHFSDGWNSWNLSDLLDLEVNVGFFGHIHKSQRLGKVKDFYYTGSPLQNNKGERGCWTGFHTYTKGKVEHHRTDSRKFYELSYDDYRNGDLPKYLYEVAGSDEKTHRYEENFPIPGNEKTKINIVDAPKAEQGSLKKLFFPGCLSFSKSKPNKRISRAEEIKSEISFEDRLRDYFASTGDLENFNFDTSKKFIKEFDQLDSDQNQVGGLSQWKSLSLANIGPHEVFQADLGEGVTSILGQNGTGKTFILEALLAGLYGSFANPERGIMNKNAKVEIEISVDNDSYKILRESNGKSTSCLLSKREDEVWIDTDGGKSKKLQADEAIRSIVGSKNVVMGCCYIDQNPKDMVDSKDTERMEWIQTWLGLGVYDKYLQVVKNNLKVLKNIPDDYKKSLTAREEQNLKLLAIEQEIEIEQNKFNSLEEELNLLKLAYEPMKELKKSIDYSYSMNLKIMESKHLLDQSKIKQEQLEKEIAEAEAFIRKTQAVVDSLSFSKRKYTELRVRKESLEERCLPLEDFGCSSNPLKCRFIDEALECKKALSGVLDDISLLDWGELKDQNLSVLASAIYLRNEKLQALTKKLHEEKARSEVFASRVDKELSEVPTPEEMNDLTNLCSDREAEIDSKRYEVICSEMRLTNLKRSRSSVCGELEKICKDLEVLEKSHGEYTCLKLLEKASSRDGIVQKLVHEALPSIQEKVDDLLNQIDVDFHLTFDTKRIQKSGKEEESFILNYHNHKTEKVYDVRSCSGGEKALIRLIWRLAILLGRNTESYSILLLDEPTAASDPRYCQATIDLLQYVSSQFNQIILVTHDEYVAKHSDHVIKL